MKRLRSEQIRDYDRMAKLFDQRLALYGREVISQALELAQLEGNEAILDACCGTGELLQLIALREHRGTLIGVDFSEAMLNVASSRLRHYPNVVLKHQPIENLRLPSDYFHLVFNTSAFHYLERPDLILNEFRRVLRPHGRLILTDLAANSRLTWLWSQVRRLFRPTHARLYRLEEMIDHLERQGFVVRHKRLIRINLLWSVMLIEAQNPAPSAPPK